MTRDLAPFHSGGLLRGFVNQAMSMLAPAPPRSSTPRAACAFGTAILLAGTFEFVALVEPGHAVAKTPSNQSLEFGKQQRSRSYTEEAGGVDLDMVWIPAGKFRMGSDLSEDAIREITGGASWNVAGEGPTRDVELDGFWIGKTEVTVGQFKKFVQDTGYLTQAEREGWMDGRFFGTPSDFNANWRDMPFAQTDAHPVVGVTWHDAMAFLDWLSRESGGPYCLPTEAQWEYVARARKDSIWHFGNDPADLGEHAWFEDNSGGTPHPVATKRPNPWGVYDIMGNAIEMCSDYYASAPSDGSPARNPLGTAEGSSFVTKGGCYIDWPGWVRPTERNVGAFDHRRPFYGFRVCRPAYVLPKDWAAWGKDQTEKIERHKPVKRTVAPPGSKTLHVGDEAPDFEFQTRDGTPLRLSELTGSVVLLHFWATQSYASSRELPKLVQLHGRYHDEGFEIVGVPRDRSALILGQYLSAHTEMAWPQAFMSLEGKRNGAGLFALFGVDAYPTTILLDRHGLVESINPSPKNLPGLVEGLLSEE